MAPICGENYHIILCQAMSESDFHSICSPSVPRAEKSRKPMVWMHKFHIQNHQMPSMLPSNASTSLPLHPSYYHGHTHTPAWISTHPSKHSSRISSPSYLPVYISLKVWIWGEVNTGLIRTKHNDYIKKFWCNHQVSLTLSSATQVKNQQNSLTQMAQTCAVDKPILFFILTLPS